MSNTLKRSGYLQTTEAVPYLPYRPAYTYTEPIYGYFVTSTGYGWSTQSGGVSAPSSGGIGGTTTVATTNNTQTKGVIGYRTVTVPAQPEQQGVPAQTVAVPPVGWTSFAHSFASVAAAGKGSFKVPQGVTGVVVGLAEYAVPNGGYGHIKHGLLFAGTHVFNAKTGADYGAYTGSQVYAVSTDGRTVSYLRDGTVIGTEASTYRSGERLYLSAVLASVGDEVDSPALESMGTGSAVLTLGAMSVRTSDIGFADVTSVLPVPTVSAGVGEYAAIMLPALAGLAGSNDTYGASAAVLPRLTGSAYQGIPPATQPASETLLRVPMVTALMLTGEVGRVAASLPMLSALISETAYGESKTVLPAPLTYAFSEPNDQGFALESLAASDRAAAATILLAIVLEGVTVGTTVVPLSLLDAAVQELIGVAPSVATQQLLDAIARTFIRAGGAGTIEGPGGRADLDTWVWHVDAAGSTSYSGYPFNSFATIGGKQYGASADGLFLLEGDDDAGAQIRGSVDLGKLDFGNAQLKTVSQCYLGVSATGHLFLKVIAEGKEFIYKTRSFSDEMQQQRITTGKGPRTNYVTAQFFNEDGADFEIDSVAFLVADLTRRI